MKNIQSKINPALTWKITLKESPLTAEEIAFIETFNPSIFCNDLTGDLWAFDTKMPSGRWLENTAFSNDLTTASAVVF